MIRDLSDELFWAYLAGFFDGEGCVTMCGTTSGPSLRIAQSGDDGKKLLEDFRYIFKTRYRLEGSLAVIKVSCIGPNTIAGVKSRRTKDGYILCVSKRSSVAYILQRMLPYLNMKKAVAQDTFRFIKVFPFHHGSKTRYGKASIAPKLWFKVAK